jgi:Kef-type K+ transport system membrane component KefB
MNLLKVLLAQLVTAAMIVAGLLMGFHYDWPDYVHTNHDVPLVWAIHTESTIAGPADIWRVNATSLIADIAIWAVLSLALVTAIGALKRKRTE